MKILPHSTLVGIAFVEDFNNDDSDKNIIEFLTEYNISMEYPHSLISFPNKSGMTQYIPTWEYIYDTYCRMRDRDNSIKFVLYYNSKDIVEI